MPVRSRQHGGDQEEARRNRRDHTESVKECTSWVGPRQPRSVCKGRWMSCGAALGSNNWSGLETNADKWSLIWYCYCGVLILFFIQILSDVHICFFSYLKKRTTTGRIFHLHLFSAPTLQYMCAIVTSQSLRCRTQINSSKFKGTWHTLHVQSLHVQSLHVQSACAVCMCRVLKQTEDLVPNRTAMSVIWNYFGYKKDGIDQTRAPSHNER